MNVLLVVNVRSGKGRGNAAANRLSSLLATHQVSRIEVPRDARHDLSWLLPRLAHADLCVVIGGDGTMHGVLPALIETRTPVFHALGTENLFAREFGSFHPDIDGIGSLLLEAIRKPRLVDADVAECSGLEATNRIFSLMLSAGPDAGVIQRLSRVRTGAISHLDYIQPIAQELRHAYLPLISLSVDGEPICEGAPGMLLIANSPQYALRINPARDACTHDGLLDVLFIPASNPLRLCVALARSRLRLHSLGAECRRLTGREVRFRLDAPPGRHALQVDGESLALTDPGLQFISGTVRVLPGALRVFRSM